MPISPPGIPAFYILLVLTYEDQHGYGIMKRVCALSDESITIGPATLYTTIKRLLESKYIEELGERPDPELDDHRRRYYRITEAGLEVVADEVARMERIVRIYKKAFV